MALRNSDFDDGNLLSFLVSDGGLNLFKPIEAVLRVMAFNSMLEHLRHGEFDVDPAGFPHYRAAVFP